MEKAYFVESSYGVKFVCHAKNKDEALKLSRSLVGPLDPIMLCEEISKQEMEELHMLH
jgi:hypothetical protein